MEREKFHTPLQTPSVTERRRRRRESVAANSPIIINLDLCEDDLKMEIAKQEQIIRDQAEIIREMKEQMDQRMNESVLIETSNKISDQEQRVHAHDFALAEAELAKAQEALRSTQEELKGAVAEKRSHELDKERLKKQLEEKNDRIKALTDDVERLKKRDRDWDQLLADARIDMDKANISNRSTVSNFESRLAKMREELTEEKTKSTVLERQVEELQERLRCAMDLCRKEPMANEKTPGKDRGASNDIEPLITTPGSTPGRMIRRVSTILTVVQQNSDLVSVEEAHQRIGALSVQSLYQQREISQLKIENSRLQTEMDECEDNADRARSDLAALQVKMAQDEWDSDRAKQYLVEQGDKVKQQKADMRLQLLELKREHALATEKIKRLESERSTGVEETRKELELLRREKEREESASRQLAEKLIEAEKRVNEWQEKTSELEEERQQRDELIKAKTEIEERLADMTKKALQLKDLVEMLDDQAETAQKSRERADERRKKAQEEAEQLRLQLDQERASNAGNKTDYTGIAAERDRLKTKVHYLNEELRETHSDYRQELANLAKQISEKKREENKGNEAMAMVEQLRSEKNRMDTDVKNVRRQCEQLKEEVAGLEKQVAEVRESEKKLSDENSKLRTGLAESVTKIEQYKSDLETSRELAHDMSEQLMKTQEKMEKYKDSIVDLDDEMKKKDRLVSYLQSQTNAKQMPKVSRKSTLLRQPSIISSMDITIVDTEEIIELENRRKDMLEQLEKKRNELSGRKEEVLQVNVQVAPSKPSRLPLSPIVNRPNTSAGGSSSSSMAPPTPKPRGAVGVMRHNIPHRWKDQLGFGMRQLKCAACFEGVPRVRYAKRCLECDVVVHSECARRVENTCGLPEQCATYYLDSHQTTTPTMNGWVRLYRDDDASREWRSAWARLEGGRLSFYDKDNLAEGEGKSFLSLDLKENSWNMRMAADAPNPEKEGANCMHIQLAGMNIYMSAPLAKARARWAEALQSARGHRLETIRRPSANLTVSTLLFALDAPANLTVNASYSLDDWLVIGCQEGLFVTSLSNPRAPFSVSGITAVYALEGAPDIGMLFSICGANRELALLSFNQLRGELSGRQPTARPQVLVQYNHVHLIMYHKIGNERYLCACNSTDINILRYDSKRDMFMHFHTLATAEPATCITPWPTGFFFGGDSFYSVTMESSSVPPKKKCLVASHIADYPIAVVAISDREILLAYQNYGRFVSPESGMPTRNCNVEWDQTPLEFGYTAPYLYLISMQSIEILQVAEYQSATSPGFLIDREIIRATGAHVVGKCENGDLHVALSSSSRTELHSFNAAQKRTVLKRKGSNGILDKRSKTSTSLISN